MSRLHDYLHRRSEEREIRRKLTDSDFDFT